MDDPDPPGERPHHETSPGLLDASPTGGRPSTFRHFTQTPMSPKSSKREGITLRDEPESSFGTWSFQISAKEVRDDVKRRNDAVGKAEVEAGSGPVGHGPYLKAG